MSKRLGTRKYLKRRVAAGLGSYVDGKYVNGVVK